MQEPCLLRKYTHQSYEHKYELDDISISYRIQSSEYGI